MSAFPRAVTCVILDGQDVKTPGTNGYLHADFSLDADGGNIWACATQRAHLVQEFPSCHRVRRFTRLAEMRGNYVYFDQATPGGANAGTEFSESSHRPCLPIRAVSLAQRHPLTLASATPNATVRYTDSANPAGPTDGSEPTETTGIVYSGTISVGSTRVIRAAAFAPE